MKSLLKNKEKKKPYMSQFKKCTFDLFSWIGEKIELQLVLEVHLNLGMPLGIGVDFISIYSVNLEQNI